MTQIPPLRGSVGAMVVDARELATAPRALVHFGQAPDGLPWLCDVDRSHRISHLYQTVEALFDHTPLADLPAEVRGAVEGALARGLMGVHEVNLDGRTEQAFVTRHSAHAMFGPTLVEQALAPSAGPRTQPRMSVTSVSSFGMQEALERSIADSKSNRHVLLTLRGETWTAIVADAARALRTPTGPFRRATFESLAGLAGATAKVTAGYETWTAPLADIATYITTLTRAGETPGGGSVTYELPRATLLRILVGVARHVGELHARGIVHGDLTPGNILLDGTRPISPDALHVEIGQIATAATFEWAAPEQVVGRPLDPRADVYSLGKMLCALIGAVPFGEKVEYVVPTGGNASRTVQLLKTDGVFLDATALGVHRDWQARWQDVLAKMLSYDRERRPESGAAVAALLSELVERFPPPGNLPLRGQFGAIVAVQRPNTWPVARVTTDG